LSYIGLLPKRAIQEYSITSLADVICPNPMPLSLLGTSFISLKMIP
jgi:hypothetical protein